MSAIGRCLICYQECSLSSTGKDEEDGFSSSSALISKELHVMFILRNIFEVPHASIQEYLESGANPSEWITLCLKCKSFVEKAKRMYREILDASRRFRKVKGDIIQYLRKNKKGPRKTLVSKLKSSEMWMTDETRIFVNEHNYSDSLIDPFVGGDCQAAKLLFSSSVVNDDDSYSDFPDNVKIEYVSTNDDGGSEEGESEFFATAPLQSNSSFNYDESKDTPGVPVKRKVKNVRNCKTYNKSDPVIPKIHKANGSSENDDGETVWFCSCGRSYGGSERLRRHLKEASMNPSEMHVCPICSKQFKRKWDVKRHLRNHPGYEDQDIDDIGLKVTNVEGNFSTNCENEQNIHRDTFASKLPLAQNLEFESFSHESKDVCKMADGTEYWNCTCGKIFLSQVTLQQHIMDSKTDLSVIGITCSICDKSFKRRFDRNRHMKKAHGMETLAVKELERCYDDADVEKNQNADDDLSVPATRDDEVDDIDNQEDPTCGDEKKHEELGLFEMADGSEHWKCSCGKLYSSQTALHRHAKEKNLDPAKWISCPYTNCKKSFTRRSQLKRHVDTVHDKKTYPCDKCGKIYKQIFKLRAHQRDKCGPEDEQT